MRRPGTFAMRLAMGLAVCLGLILSAWPARAIERHEALSLGKVKRVYVEKLGGGETSDQMRDMLIAALQTSGLFSITENPDRADAVLRGSSDDVAFMEEHQTSETLGVHTQSGSGGNSQSAKRYGGAGLTDNESSHIRERRHEASASVRLVDAEGEVLWSTTQESAGAKFRGAMADVADKITRRLTEDVRRARAVNQ